MKNFLNELKNHSVAITIVVISAIVGLTVYNINDRSLMAKNIDNAIAKGVNPLAVRCSYASSQDMVCVAYGASHDSNVSKK